MGRRAGDRRMTLVDDRRPPQGARERIESFADALQRPQYAVVADRKPAASSAADETMRRPSHLQVTSSPSPPGPFKHEASPSARYSPSRLALAPAMIATLRPGPTRFVSHLHFVSSSRACASLSPLVQAWPA